MRKWTYLVAALLMGGVSTSLTSCIDNEEPAGITDLRGAKAEFIRAKADYEAALTAYQLVENQIKEQELARETILTQMKELELQVSQAQTDYDVARINAQKDLLVEQYNTQLTQQKAWTAQAQAALVQALNALEIINISDRNNQFTQEIEDIRLALTATNGALDDLVAAQDALLDAKANVLDYVSENKYFKARKELTIATKENDLAILEGLLKDYQSITGADKKALTEKLAAVEKEINALDQKELDEWQKLQELRKSDAFLKLSDAIQEIELTLEKDTTFTVKKVDAAIANGFYTAVNNAYGYISNFNINDFFKQGATNEYEMTADLVSPEKELKYLSVAELQNQVKQVYQEEYTNEYNRRFYTAPKRSYELFDETGKVKTSIATNVAAEKNRLEKVEAPQIKKEFEETVKAWIDAKLAIDKYLVDNQSQTVDAGFAAIAQAVKDYNDPEVTKTKDAKAAKALRDKLLTYADTRNAIDDGAEYMERNVLERFKAEKTTDPLDDAATLADFNMIIASGTDALGIYADLQWYYGTSGNYEGTSIIKKYYEADAALFHGSSNSYNALNEGQTPILGENNKVPENLADAIAEDLKNTTYGLYIDYLASIDFAELYPYIANIDLWTALNDNLTKQEEEIAARKKDLTDAKDAILVQHEEEMTQVWKQELAVYLIKGSESVGDSYEQVISDDNPAKQYLNNNESNGIIGYSERTELKALQDEKGFIEDAIENDCKFIYMTYDETTDTYKVNTSSDLTGLIEGTQEDIIDLQEEIEAEQLAIDKFEQLGFANNEYQEILDAKVKQAEQDVKILQTIVDNYTKTLKDLLNAYNPDDTSTPGTSEEGGETPAE